MRAEDDVVALPLERDLVLCPFDMEDDPQTSFDQHGDRCGVPVSPRVNPPVAVGVYPPLQLDIRLMSRSAFGGNELTEEPPAISNIVDLGVSAIE